MLTGPPVFRVNGIVRETLISASGAALPSNVVIRVAALAREALFSDAGTFRVAAVVREALVSEAEAPPPSDQVPRFWTAILAWLWCAKPAHTRSRCVAASKPFTYPMEATMTGPASSPLTPFSEAESAYFCVKPCRGRRARHKRLTGA